LVTTTPQATAIPVRATRPAALSPPQLAEGVQLIGDYEGSGYRETPSLVRRGDGQVIQLPDLLYRLAGKADGNRSYPQLAEELGEEIHRTLDAADVQFLVEEKLRPLGILAAADGSSPSTEKADPFLAFRFRIGVVSEKASGALGTIFKPLFFPAVVLAVLVSLVAADYWLFFLHGVAQALRQSLLHPGLFLPLFGAVVLSAALHEIGHAAACRYGGGHPGKMGCGLYLAWPAFYTDVTDAYRLSRRARLRTDLGGVYLNVIIIIATVGAYFATHFEPLLLLVLIEHLEIVHQLLPIVRLDGYYIVADLTGVPDLFARIGPILASVIPGRRPDERVAVLKRWVRWTVTAWVVVVIPLLGFELLVVLIHLPRIIATAGDSAGALWDRASGAINHGNALGALSDGIQLVVLAIPIIGIVLMLWRFAKQIGVWGWRHTEGHPVRRSLATLVAAVAVGMLLLSWLPRHNYRPIQPHERGTVGEGIAAVRYLPQQPSQLDQRATAGDVQETTTTTVVPLVGSTATTVPGTNSTTTSVVPSGGPFPVTATTVVSSATTPPRPTTTVFPPSPPGT
jgi:putative peptide zinc metalloprotease protein